MCLTYLTPTNLLIYPKSCGHGITIDSLSVGFNTAKVKSSNYLEFL